MMIMDDRKHIDPEAHPEAILDLPQRESRRKRKRTVAAYTGFREGTVSSKGKLNNAGAANSQAE